VATHRVRARPARGSAQLPRLRRGDDLLTHLADAARTPGGHSPALAEPEDEGQVAAVLRAAPAVLPIGAQSSLTGGATPHGEWLLSTARLTALEFPASDRVRAGAGLPLSTLEDEARPHGLFYPPVPTWRGATVGGVLATNAAGANTFKYGSTRAWVEALTVVLADGGALDLRRGEARAHPHGFFEVERPDGQVTRVPVPTYRMPDVPKRSAGYHAEPGMDLVDLFVGSEGTLGIVTSAELRLLTDRPRLWALAFLDDEARALALVGELRGAAQRCWRAGPAAGPDVAAIESLDARCLALLREDAQDREQGVRLPQGARCALLIELELPGGATSEEVQAQLAAWDEPGAAGPLTDFVRLLAGHRALEGLELALPGDLRRARQLLALREAVPEGVNRRIGEWQRAGQPALHKLGGDLIVPWPSLPGFVAEMRARLEQDGLEHAFWGHVSDGNLHPNVLPRDEAQLRAGLQALLDFGRRAIELHGCPLSEHGVGRSRIKQQLLRELYGEGGIEQMRRVKQALDPQGRLAPGVLFPARGE
jgi:D-lactate dehydrogenase (cytochrome)